MVAEFALTFRRLKNHMPQLLENTWALGVLSRMTGVDPTVTMTAVAEIVIMGATAGTVAMAGTVVIGVIGSMVVVITGTENTVIAVPLDAAFLRLVAGVAIAVPRLVVLDPALRVVTMFRLTVPGAGKQSNAYSFWTIFFKAKPPTFQTISRQCSRRVDRTVLVHVKSHNDPAVTFGAACKLTRPSHSSAICAKRKICASEIPWFAIRKYKFT